MICSSIITVIILVRYKYTDPSTSSGSWIYRVRDCDATGAQKVIAQCFVEVQSATEQKTQAVSLISVFL